MNFNMNSATFILKGKILYVDVLIRIYLYFVYSVDFALESGGKEIQWPQRTQARKIDDLGILPIARSNHL